MINRARIFWRLFEALYQAKPDAALDVVLSLVKRLDVDAALHVILAAIARLRELGAADPEAAETLRRLAANLRKTETSNDLKI